MKQILSIFFLSLFSHAILAQQIGIETARSRAYEFAMQQVVQRAAQRGQTQQGDLQVPELAYTCYKEDRSQTCFYVFNLGDNQGFVLVGGDETAKQILGYSERGSFDWETAPENVRWWLSQYQRDISMVMDMPKGQQQRCATAPAATRHDIEPLIKTWWGQDAPYNNKLNEMMKEGVIASGYTGSSYPSFPIGCVATALAQLMKRYNYPEHGEGEIHDTGTHSWQNTNFTYHEDVDYANTTYQWSQMLNGYTASSTDEQRDAVATLMFHTAVACHMNYNYLGSSASYRQGILALIHNFRYDKSVLNRLRSAYSDEVWESMIYNELSAGRPLLYSGTAEIEGHAFICDGYRASDNTYHFNFGWKGSSDGYYVLSGTDVSLAGYYRDQEAFFDVKPDEGGDYIPFCTQTINERETDTEFKVTLYNDDTNLPEYTFDYSTNYYTGLSFKLPFSALFFKKEGIVFGYRATERTTGYTTYLTTNRVMEFPMFGSCYYSHSTSTQYLYLRDLNYNGVYDIQPVVRFASQTGDDAWHDVELYSWQQTPVITVINYTDPSQPRDVDISVSSSVVRMRDQAYFSLPQAYLGQTTYISSDTSIATVDESGIITPVSPGQTTITVQCTEYTNGVKLFNATTQTFDIEVKPVEADFYMPPYTHNDNNICPDDRRIYFPIVRHDPDAKYLMVYSSSYYVSYSRSGSRNGSYSIELERDTIVSGWLYADMNEPGRQYTIEFYLDSKHNRPFNIPSITYTCWPTLTYTYTVPASGVGTLLLPFYAQVPEGCDVYHCLSIDSGGSTAILQRSDTIARNHPYIFVAEPGSEYTFIGPKAIHDDEHTFIEGQLRGAMIAEHVALDQGDYVLDTRNGVTAFYRYTTDSGSGYCDEYRAVIHPQVPTTADVIYLQLPSTPGDVNGDNRITITDITTLVQHLRGLRHSLYTERNADADQNGTVNDHDAVEIGTIILK